MTDIPEQIASLLIPMHGRPLLVPNAAVAEIVNWPELEQIEGTPSWMLGMADWRGVQLPVVSLERLNDPSNDDAEGGQRLLVINAQGHYKAAFYGVAVQGIPRLIRVFPEEIGEQQELVDDKVFDMLVMVSGERAIIPDLPAVEDFLNQITR